MPDAKDLPNAMDLLFQLGELSMLVIVVWVGVMLFASILDRRPRSNQSSGDDTQSKKRHKE